MAKSQVWRVVFAVGHTWRRSSTSAGHNFVMLDRWIRQPARLHWYRGNQPVDRSSWRHIDFVHDTAQFLNQLRILTVLFSSLSASSSSIHDASRAPEMALPYHRKQCYRAQKLSAKAINALFLRVIGHAGRNTTLMATIVPTPTYKKSAIASSSAQYPHSLQLEYLPLQLLHESACTETKQLWCRHNASRMLEGSWNWSTIL